MFSFRFRKNLLITLITLSIVLLAANILLKNNFLVSEGSDDLFDRKEIRNKFLYILNEFSIEEKLIKESKTIDKNSDEEIVSFKIQVPGDLTIPEVLQGIYQTFRKDSIIINSVEKVKGGKTLVTLKSRSSTLLRAEFDYSKKYFRNKGYLVFIIYNADLENSEIISLIESPIRLNFLVRPQAKYVQLTEIILQNSQQYSVLIDDDISEQKYQLGPGFSEARVKNVVKTLVTDFRNAICFIVDDNSNFYNSKNYEVFKNELIKRNIKLFKKSDFVNLSYDENTSSIFIENLKSLTEGGTIVFLLNAESYSALKAELIKYQKQGFRVITSSLAL